MPEIALTPQIESRLKAVFGDMVGFGISKITKAQKKKFLDKLHNGDIRVIGLGSSSSCIINFAGDDAMKHDDGCKSQSAAL